MKFQVTLPNGECLNIVLKSKELNGASLINEVNTQLNISDDISKYFGLYYSDRYDGGKNWIQVGDDLKKMNAIQCAGIMQLQFAVHIFPKDPHLLFPSAEIRRLFRQHIKHLLVNDLMRCDTDTLAKLDAFIAQAELGNHELAKKNYSQKLDDLQIYVPICLISGIPVTENQYQRKVQSHHITLKDMNPAKADILFLSTVKNIQTYGYIFYKISDSTRKQHFLALSSAGIHFIYETTVEKAISSDKRDTFAWTGVFECKINNKAVKMQVSTTQNDMVERKFKIKSKYSHKDASRFKDDIERYKDVYCADSADSASQTSTRLPNSKGAPRRAKTISGKLSTWRHSMKRVKSTKERNVVSP